VGDPRVVTAKSLHADKKMPVMDICRTLQVSRPTLYRWLAMKSAISTG
jgi:transposase-like protein